MNVNGPENIRNHRFVSVVIDIFSKFAWTTPLKKNCSNKKRLFRKCSHNFKRKPNLVEADCGKELLNSIFQNFSNINNTKHYTRNTFLGVDFAEKIKRTIRDLPKGPVFERGGDNWSDVVPTITNHYINRVHSSSKLRSIQVSLQKNEGFSHKKFLDKRKVVNPMF